MEVNRTVVLWRQLKLRRLVMPSGRKCPEELKLREGSLVRLVRKIGAFRSMLRWFVSRNWLGFMRTRLLVWVRQTDINRSDGATP